MSATLPRHRNLPQLMLQAREGEQPGGDEGAHRTTPARLRHAPACIGHIPKPSPGGLEVRIRDLPACARVDSRISDSIRAFAGAARSLNRSA